MRGTRFAASPPAGLLSPTKLPFFSVFASPSSRCNARVVAMGAFVAVLLCVRWRIVATMSSSSSFGGRRGSRGVLLTDEADALSGGDATARHDERVKRGFSWRKQNQGGGNRCALDQLGGCGKRATCVKNVCACAVLYGGKSCERMIALPLKHEEGEESDLAIRVRQGNQVWSPTKSGDDENNPMSVFEGVMTLNKQTCGPGTRLQAALTVKLPSKRLEMEDNNGLARGLGLFGKKRGDENSKNKGVVNVGTVEQTVLNRIAEEDEVTPRDEPWTNCAVVGKSGALLSYENGPSIDQHHAVIRVDDLPTRGFEQSVGSRTTVRICGDAKLPFCQKYVRENVEETLIANITNGNSLRAFARIHRLHDNSVGAVTKKRLKFEAFHPEFMEFVAEAIEGISPMTTEAQAIIFALLNCASVDIYGIGLGPNEGFSVRYDGELGSSGDRKNGADSGSAEISSNGVTSEEDQVKGSFNILKTLYNFGLAHIAERCIVECHISPDACVLCQTELLHAVESDF